MKEFITEKAIVRIHPGKLSDEERKKVLENAARQFFMANQIAHDPGTNTDASSK